jgi:lipoprotein-releasing system ATP-binding protein
MTASGRSSSAVLEASDILKGYGKTIVLRGASIYAGAGEAVAILGPSGSGKSTFMAVIGLLQEWSEGSVRRNGEVVSPSMRSLRYARRRFPASWVPQLPVVLPGRSTLDNALVSLRFQTGSLTAVDVQRSREVLEQVGLGHVVRRDVSVLSGGELQRLSVARAILSDAPLVLADEPTASLDHTNAVRVATALVTNRGTRCVIVATHDPRVAAACDRRVRLVDGRTFEE